MIQKTSYRVSQVGFLGKKTELDCPKHGSQSFNFEKAGNRYRCSRCNADAVLARKLKLKAELVEAAGGCCSRCGYDRSVSAMHFHHRDRSEKLFSLSRMTSYSKALCYAEAEKCDLLCANCHAEVEDELRLTGDW